MFKHVRWIIILLLLSIILVSCSFTRRPIHSDDTKMPDSTPEENGSVIDNIVSPTAIPAGSIKRPYTTEGILATMTLEEKIGQMFFIASRYDGSGQRQLNMDESLEKNLDQFTPGGFIFFTENLDTIPQTKSFIQNIQNKAKIPMFIGIDEEGGIVSRLNKAEKFHSTIMPEPYAIGSTRNKEYAYKAAQAIAEEIKSLGFNLNFAPVADVISNPENKVIGERAYSSDVFIASEMVAEAVKGTKQVGIVPVLKHFPGHGSTIEDSHTGSAMVENDLERLKEVELPPFKTGIEAGAEMVMTAHVMTPRITENGLPATLSQPIIQGILRDQLGFDGVIITDGLEMDAISSFYNEEEAVVMAVQAGVDMLLLPNDLNRSYNAILTAVKDGRISEQRIDESVKRILDLKIKTIINVPIQNLDPEKVLGSQQHLELAEQIRKDIKP